MLAINFHQHFLIYIQRLYYLLSLCQFQSIQVLTLVFQLFVMKNFKIQWNWKNSTMKIWITMSWCITVNVLQYLVLLCLFFLFLNNLKVSCVDHCNSLWTPRSKTFSSITTITSHVRILTIIPQYISSNTHLIFQFLQLFQKYVLWLYFSFEKDQIKDHTLYLFSVSLVSFILE